MNHKRRLTPEAKKRSRNEGRDLPTVAIPGTSMRMKLENPNVKHVANDPSYGVTPEDVKRIDLEKAVFSGSGRE